MMYPMGNVGIGGQFGGYNPYSFGYGMGGYNPYSFGLGMGGFGGYNPYSFGYGYGMGEPQQNPYQSFFDSFQAQLDEMMSKYTQPAEETVDTGSAGATSGSSSSGSSSGSTDSSAGSTSEPAKPDFGNLGARLNKGGNLTMDANKKLLEMGYTDQQVLEAKKAAGSGKGAKKRFQDALANM